MTATPEAPSVLSRSRMPATADLNDPLYYLANFETVLQWVYQHHSDLLLPEERACIEKLMALAPAARALMARMVMRSGDHFRTEKMTYPEIGLPVPEAIAELADNELLDPEPELGLAQVFALFTLPELRPALSEYAVAAGLKPTASKSLLKETLTPELTDHKPIWHWLPELDTRVVRLNHQALFDRIRLMFFGNLRQSWSDFVLVELGHQQFEKVPFTDGARAFDSRNDVDCYLQMHHCRERLDGGESPADIWRDLPEASGNAWLESRRGRLLFELAKQAERIGDLELALISYGASRHRDARLRQLRLLERQKRFKEAWELAGNARLSPRSDGESQGLTRLLTRLAKKLDKAAPAKAPTPEIPTFALTLDNPNGYSVEWRCMEHLSEPDAPVAYVENTLITGLFGLLCWPAIFAPVPGAFFHPFHNGPVDLYREDFLERRSALFNDCLALLETDAYKARIRETWQAKAGIASPFVVWPVLSEPLLEMALDCLPTGHLKKLFTRLMDDLRQHRSGFPDLIQFSPNHPDPNQRYEMIEVKGPGDRLQDHQTRWLEYCVENDIPVSVCYVRWAESTE